ncbi:cytochrome P450 family 2 subfamily A member 6, partial [Chelydra serpentina]
RPCLHPPPGPPAGGGAVRIQGGDGGPGGPGRGLRRARDTSHLRLDLPWLRSGLQQRGASQAATAVLHHHAEELRGGQERHRGADPGGGSFPAGSLAGHQRSAL